MRKFIFVAVVFLIALVALPQLVKAEEVKADNGVIVASLNGNNADNIAQISLGQVASHDRTLRLISGGSLVLLSGVLVSLIVNGNETFDAELASVTGMAAVVVGSVGTYKLLIRSESEKEYAKITRETNPAIREFMAVDSLDYLAGKAQKNRIKNGITDLSLAAYSGYLYYVWDKEAAGDSLTEAALSQAVFSFGGAIYNLLIPKYVERVNQKVQEQKFTKVSVQDNAMPVLVLNF